MNRREALARLGIGVAGIAAGACKLGDSPLPDAVFSDGRLAARPLTPGQTPVPGTTRLGINDSRDAILHVPPGLPPGPAPLVVALHGDPGSADDAVGWFRGLSDDLGFIMLAPSSQGRPWDRIVTPHYSEDAIHINLALEATFARCDVDPGRIALAGFSAGASYAIALGRTNGDFFRRVTAFAPTFYLAVEHVGRPEFFITHGIADPVSPINFASREIVPKMRADGYEVRYEEFVGGHTIPVEFARTAFTWMIEPVSLARGSLAPEAAGSLAPEAPSPRFA